MVTIIWFHIRACARDLRARRLGNLQISRDETGQVHVTNSHRDWRLR